MSVEHTDRRGRGWQLCEKKTKTGKTTYYFSMKPGGALVRAVPEGYEIYENPQAQVFLRKRAAQLIRPEELALVEAALARHGESWMFKADANKCAIVVHEASGTGGLDGMYQMFRGRRMTQEEALQSASYQAMMRFTLVDKETRGFTVERYCFRGRIDDWIWLDGPGSLAALVKKYVQHLGRESFFELV